MSSAPLEKNRFEPAAPSAETPAIEPYRPDMLPRAGLDDVPRPRPEAPAPAFSTEPPATTFGSQPL